MKRATRNRREDGGAKKEWTPPTLKHLGRVADIINMPGGGKTSITTADTGDLPLKPPGQSKMDP